MNRVAKAGYPRLYLQYSLEHGRTIMGTDRIAHAYWDSEHPNRFDSSWVRIVMRNLSLAVKASINSLPSHRACIAAVEGETAIASTCRLHIRKYYRVDPTWR